MSKDDEKAIETDEQQVSPGGIAGLIARLREVPSKAILILGIIFGLSLAGAITLWAIYQMSLPKLTAEKVLEALDNQQLEQARLLALELNESGDVDPELAGVPAYVVGVVESRYAEDEWNPQKQKVIYASVATNMNHARSFGIPDDRQSHADYLLAKGLFWSGNYKKCLPVMKKTVLQQSPSRRAELIGYMIDVYLRDPKLSKEQALTDLRKFLADTEFNVEQRDDALLHEANLLIHLNRFPEAQQRLALLSSRPEIRQQSQLVTGQMEFAQAVHQSTAESNNTLNATLVSNAMTRFNNVIESAPESPLADQARLNLADAQFHIGDFEQAHIAYSYLSRQFEESPLGIHAAIKEATTLLRLERINEGVMIFKQAMVDAAKPQNQSLNRWLDPYWIQRKIREASEYLMEKSFFAEAVQLSKDMLQMVASFKPSVSTEVPRLLKAESFRRWAEHLEKESKGGGTKASEQTRKESLARHRAAGHAYYQYSLARKDSRDYPEQLFRAAEHFFLGHDMIRAVKAYELYLDTGDPQFAAQSYIRLAEANMAMQDFGKAHDYAQQTWESFPKDPVVYKARIVAATIRQEQGNLEEAKENLLANIDSQELTPQSQEWIDSKLLYGQIQFDQASVHEAEARKLGWKNGDPAIAKQAQDELQESYRLYLDAIDTLIEYSIRTEKQGPSLHVQYILGQSYSRAAQWPRLQSQITTINTQRAEWNRKHNELLVNAYNEFRNLCEYWTTFEDRGELDDFQRQLLMNSYFGRGSSLFHMQQHEQALQAYRAIATRYIKQPEALEAFVQMANCYRHLDQHEEARNVISQAKLALSDRIPKDANYTETTRYSHDEWASLLDLLERM